MAFDAALLSVWFADAFLACARVETAPGGSGPDAPKGVTSRIAEPAPVEPTSVSMVPSDPIGTGTPGASTRGTPPIVAFALPPGSTLTRVNETFELFVRIVTVSPTRTG